MPGEFFSFVVHEIQGKLSLILRQNSILQQEINELMGMKCFCKE